MNNSQPWRLLEPVKVGAVLFKNRMVMAPMSSRLSNADGSVSKKLIDYYVARARGGVGAILVEYSYVDSAESKTAVCQLGVHSDHMLPGLNELAEGIKSWGAAALMQLAHGGRQSNRALMGKQPVAPSAVTHKVHGTTPREMTIPEIKELQRAFVEAAVRTGKAGFDGVEIHGAHGYLIGQFLSPYTNQRTDEYGRDLAGRARFSLETIAMVREKMGGDFIVGYRISGDEYVPGGLTIAETTRVAEMVEKAGADYVHVSAGMVAEAEHHLVPPMYMGKACNLHLAEAVKKVVSIPVITVGSHDVNTGEEAIRAGQADLVALGRTLIADPDLPNKLASGQVAEIRPCIRGNEGCVSRFYLGRTMRCEVNPTCGREADSQIAPAAIKKSVMVVGGGIAGMEAARVAALRGHDVTLVERSNSLGGHLIEATVPHFKQETKQLLTWAIHQLEGSRVKVRLGTEATPASIRQARPDVLVIAVGSDFLVPPVPGCDKACVITAGDVLLGKRKMGDRVVVVGAGLIGSETALYIADELKKQVTIVEMLDEMLIGVQAACQQALKEKLQGLGVATHLGWRLTRIIDGGVVCSDHQQQTHELSADTVVLATGLGARTKSAEELQGLVPETYVIGDCSAARKIYNCTEDAWRCALRV